MNDVANESSGIKGLWHRLGNAGRTGLIAGVLLSLGTAVGILWWSMRTDYQVLFANLEEADASAVVAELKSQKIAYRLSDTEGTILVPAGLVYATRLALMSGDVPLSGGVGFEIFDRQGLGATEQSQRVAYQRALQGELARTIGALEQVRQARVLLVLPESTLFKRDQQKPRAAVSLVLDAGAQLSGEQVLGVQRLVAASVAGMEADQVVVSDQRGVTLSEPDPTALNAAATGSRLKLKSELENYFSGKIDAMLEKVLGPGKAIVTVDVTLNFDQITRSLQTLIPLHSDDAARAGAVLKRREARSRPYSSTEDEQSHISSNDTVSYDIEYEYGKKLEQVAAAPGALSRLSVSLIVPGTLTEERASRLQQLVRAAVGLDQSRGDTVVVDSLDRVANEKLVSTESAGTAKLHDPSVNPSVTAASPAVVAMTQRNSEIWNVALFLAGALIAVSLYVRFRSGNLSARAREMLLADIVATLKQPSDASRRN